MVHTLSRKRGVSTILGTLIFIGILFSAVVPMFLVMKQADVLFEQRKHEQQRVDEEKSLENIEVYVLPSSDQLTITLLNKGEVEVTLIRVWVNEDPTPISVEVLAQSSADPFLIPLSQPPSDGDTFDVRVTSERGNVFLHKNGILTYGSSGWELEKFYIRIYAGGIFMYVKVTHNDETIYEEWDIIGAGYEIIVPEDGTYHVLIKKLFSTVFDGDVTINWPPETYVEIYP